MTGPIDGLVELEKATLAFQLALTKIGVKSIAAALRMWRRIPANHVAEVADDWLNDAVQMIMSHRAQSTDLGVAYYRLARALRTGTTIPDPHDPIPKQVSLAELRSEFKRMVDDASKPLEEASQRPPSKDTPERPHTPQKGSQGAGDAIPIQRLPGWSKDGDGERARLDAEAEKEARIVLKALGPNSLQRQVKEIDHSQPANEVDKKRDEAHKKSGSRQAAAADRLVKNGGRGMVYSLGQRDKKVKGYVRFSTTGTPCGWCAMLISRGLILYRSESSATTKSARAASVIRGEAEVGDKYHDNCKCIAVPVYGVKDYKSSLFDLNREYAKLWPKVTKGYSGKAAVAVWRAYIRQQQKAHPGGVAPDNDNAQEAV